MRSGKRLISLSSQLLNPEIPLFGGGLIVSAVICGLVSIVFWTTFLKGLPGVETYFSLGNYAEVFLHPLTLRAGINTLFLGIGTVMVNLFLAIPMAWLIHRTNTPYKSFFLTLMFLHILLPGFLKTMGWIMLLSPQIGLINQLLRIFIPVETGPLSIYNVPSMVFLQGLFLTPTMFFMLSGALLAIDPVLEESAEAVGSTRFRCLRYITFQLIKPAIVAAMIYNFMTAVSMFEVPALLGAATNIQVFSTLMYSSVRTEIGLPNYGVAGVYGVILLLPMLIALYFYQKMLRLSYRYVTVTGKGYKPKLIDLGWWKWVGVSFIGIFFLADLFIPLLAVVWTSFLPRIQMPTIKALATLTTAGYRSAITMLGGGIFVNTAQLMISVGVLVIFISLVISWIVLRTRLPGRYAMDTIAMLPQAVPRLAFAFSLSFIALLLIKKIPLYGSLTIIILAHTVSYVAFGTRAVNGALIQIHRDLEDAVETCGCSRIVALRRIIVPLLFPTLFYTTIWISLLSYREVTMALFLQFPKNVVLSTAIWQQWQGGDTATAAALGVIMTVLIGVVISVLLRAFPSLFIGGKE